MKIPTKVLYHYHFFVGDKFSHFALGLGECDGVRLPLGRVLSLSGLVRVTPVLQTLGGGLTLEPATLSCHVTCHPAHDVLT